jgi:hypothetical protein
MFIHITPHLLAHRTCKTRINFPKDCHITTACTQKSPKTLHLNEQFYSAMHNFKKRCSRCNSGPLCKIFNDITCNIEVDEINELHVKKMITDFKQNPHVLELAEKIKVCLQEDPEIRKDIEFCALNGDKKSCCRFEKHLRAKARQHCGIGCLFNRDQMDTCMAAVFCAAMECFDPSAVSD